MIAAVIQHVVIATLFAILVMVIIWTRKADGSRFRYRLWLAAALNFAIPTAIFSRFGAWVHHLFPKQVIAHSIYASSTQIVSNLNQVWPQAGRNSSLWVGLATV